MKTTAVKGQPGIRIKENGKFIVFKSISGNRTTREFTTLKEAVTWKKDKSSIDLKVNGKDPTLSGQGEGRNEIFFRDVYFQYLEEGMLDLDEYTAIRKKRRMERFLPNLYGVKISELNGRVILKHIQDMKLVVDENSRRCNFDKELKDLSSVLNWYDEEVAPFHNPIRKKHFLAGKIQVVPKKKKNIPAETVPVVCSYLEKMLRQLVTMQFLLGCRIGEVCALNDRTVDFKNGTIELSEVIQWRDSVPHHKFETKTEAITIKEMTPLMREILWDLKNSRPRGCKFFFHTKGKMIRYNYILEKLNKALKDSGNGEYSGTHILRYSMGSFSRKKKGLDVAQAMLSHSDARMTEGYAELDVNKDVTGVVIEAEELFKVGATRVQPSCNQRRKTVN